MATFETGATIPDAWGEPTIDPSTYGNVLTAFLDTEPHLKAIVYVVGTVAAAIVLVSWLSPGDSTRAPGRAPSDGDDGHRRRAPECALAIVPDGSKDRSEREWRRLLPPPVYASLRKGETEPPNLETEDGGLDDVLAEDGQYHCAGCGTPLDDSDARFEAGCGWPCFFTCLKGAVRERRDEDGTRMELVCNACNGHIGHIFRGEAWALPPPAERHCVNNRSLRFYEDPPETERAPASDADDDSDEDLDGIDEDAAAATRDAGSSR